MKLSETYEIKIVVLEIKENGIVGDIYDNYFNFRFDKPYASYRFGYIVYDNTIQSIPDGYDDWYDSIEEAIDAFQSDDRWLPF